MSVQKAYEIISATQNFPALWRTLQVEICSAILEHIPCRTFKITGTEILKSRRIPAELEQT